jgi:hypothetical protein
VASGGDEGEKQRFTKDVPDRRDDTLDKAIPRISCGIAVVLVFSETDDDETFPADERLKKNGFRRVEMLGWLVVPK